jgi:hypothetical protein
MQDDDDDFGSNLKAFKLSFSSKASIECNENCFRRWGEVEKSEEELTWVGGGGVVGIELKLQ